MSIGIKPALALAAGGLLLLFGLIGLVLAPAGPPAGERGRSRRTLLALSSALLAAVGGAIVLGVGVILPLQVLKNHARVLVAINDRNNDQNEAALRLRCAEEIRTILGEPKYSDPKRLNRHEYKVFSQNGEDGMIAEVFRRIGTTNRYFVEFGSSDGMQNNTVFLLRHESWGGLWIDGDHEAVGRADEHFRPEIEAKKLTVMESFITAENIEDLFRRAKVPEEFDLLSIDIDRNDYYVWEKIAHYRPRLVIVEYNPLYPPTMSWVIPYDPNAMWDHTSHSGASLKALEELGAKKGYRMVGCNISGVNSFFVRDDLVGDHFAAPYTAENHYEPSRYDLFWHDSNHPRVP